MFAIPTLGGIRTSAYSAGGGIWDSPNRAEVFRRPPRWIRGSAGAGTENIGFVRILYEFCTNFVNDRCEYEITPDQN